MSNKQGYEMSNNRNNLQTCHIKCEEIISQLSVIPGEKANGVMTCGHIERKDEGHTARLVYLFSGPFGNINQYFMNIVSICPSTIK